MKSRFGLGLALVLAIFVFGVLSAGASDSKVFQAKYLDNGPSDRQLLFFGYVPGSSYALRTPVQEVRYPRQIVEHEPLGTGTIVELISSDQKLVEAILSERQVIRNILLTDGEGRDEVIKLVESGPSSNRIDLVFMGDGYTEAERTKFIGDMKRLTNDIFQGKTFSSYLPLFNVYAVYRASKESGIGKNNTPKNTAYRLYRLGNTLRAIYAQNTSAARNSCSKAPGCDYPILVANDPYYGGLGGEFAITTSSPTSGTMVLRHELGHNFGKVGEEYDGGGYFGANVSSSSGNLKWKHWLSGKGDAEAAKARFIKWPWHKLSKGPYRAKFKSDGNYGYSEVQFSASGIDTDETLEITLDGNRLSFKSPGHNDRTFHEMSFNSGFSAGNHELVFTERVKDGNNWLSDLTVYEYGKNYHFDKSYVGAYPLFHANGSVAAYRSTHESCLMRNMKSHDFCPNGYENMWLKFLAKVTLIDDINVEKSKGKANVALKVLALGKFRKNGHVAGEKLEIRWFKNGTEVKSLAGKTTWTEDLSQAQGRWEVRVKLWTPQVRKDPNGLLQVKRSFSI